jgi:hypothetical protein
MTVDLMPNWEYIDGLLERRTLKKDAERTF